VGQPGPGIQDGRASLSGAHRRSGHTNIYLLLFSHELLAEIRYRLSKYFVSSVVKMFVLTDNKILIYVHAFI
jgi:hypothetical protein